jgi:hypothetical protein
MASRKFHIEYLLNNNIVRQRIRRWADQNRNLFPEYNFTNISSDFPTTHFIANRLENQFNFQRIEDENEVVLRGLHFLTQKN